nr:HAMP domain-containing sensor histidine kinase [Altericroceibacterium indicum]
MALQELAAPLTLLLVFGVLVLWLTLRKSLSIIGRLADTLNARSLAELKPLDPVEWPSDLWPVITALNTLFARLDQAYEREQAFTDDIAHELRTPLAAIRARAQLVHKSLPNVHEDDIARLIACVDRACDLIGGMLIHARLDTVKLSRRSADIHAIVSDVVAEALLDIPSDSIQFTVNPDYIVRWPCDVSSLTIALSAVIDNAVRHAGEGGHVDIAMVRSSERLDIMIADKGPGIPVEDRKRLQRRFERGTSPSSGSGLGLAIAVTAMKLMGGTLILQDRQDGPGLLVILRLPAS